MDELLEYLGRIEAKLDALIDALGGDDEDDRGGDEFGSDRDQMAML